MDLRPLLSPAQYEAATRLDAPVCILAGAGSGKTRVITHRIAWLIDEHRASPSSIVGVTFTNKAAKEMRDRVEKLVPGAARHVHLGTFHGLAARLLRRFGRVVDVDPSFVIYDQDDSERLIKRIIVNDLDKPKETVAGVRALIEHWHNEGFAPQQVPSGSYGMQDELARDVYFRYADALRTARALDFGSLLVKLRDLVTGEHHDVITKRVRHVLADEYQDVNAVQAQIVLALGKGADTIAVVGDDDQAIYGWRGASAHNLQRFMHDMTGAVLVKLEENYRSTAAILEAANGIIAHNDNRLGKRLVPAHDDSGRRVRLIRNVSDRDETKRVVNYLIEHSAAGTNLDDIAILYRTNGMSRAFEDELRRHGLPYRVVGGTCFYDRKEIKDVLATLRVALNRDSDVDGLRFLQAVPRGIGDTTIKKLEAAARERRASLFGTMANDNALKSAGLSAAVQKKAKDITKVLDDLAAQIGRPTRPDPQPGLFVASSSVGAKAAVALAVQASGVADRLEAERASSAHGDIEAEGRLDNLQELVNAAAAFEEDARAAGDVGDVTAFLENAALLGSADDDNTEGDWRGKITLMTLHACKGLEFDVVFIAGLEEHGFPHSRAIVDDSNVEELEEERRLAYVGITRAKKRLYLSWATKRLVHGQLKDRDASRFLDELPLEALEGDIPRKLHRRASDERRSMLDTWRARHGRALHAERDDVVYDDDSVVEAPRRTRQRNTVLVQDVPHDEPEATRVVLDDVPDVAPRASSDVGEGSRVVHKLFGEGTVVGQRSGGTLSMALVRFDAERAPRLIATKYLQRC